MKRLFVFGVFCALLACLGSALAGGRGKRDEVKEALQELNDYIGQWKGHGTLSSDERSIWPEKADWSWRFKGKDSWLKLDIPNGKYFKGGELRYLPEDESYQLTATENGKKVVYEGEIKNRRLLLQRKDPQTKETYQIQMNMAGGGIRFILRYKVKPADRTLFSDRYMVAYTKEGETLGSAKKKVECVVTGGLGTIEVSYMGKTYYVCCSGCKEAFYENPAKVIAEYEKRKRSGQ